MEVMLRHYGRHMGTSKLEISQLHSSEVHSDICRSPEYSRRKGTSFRTGRVSSPERRDTVWCSTGTPTYCDGADSVGKLTHTHRQTHTFQYVTPSTHPMRAYISTNLVSTELIISLLLLKGLFYDSLEVNTKAVRYFETSENIYQTTLRQMTHKEYYFFRRYKQK